MQERNIWDIKAGIEFHSNLNQLLYMSDNTPADVKSVFARINYGGDWTDGDHNANWQHDHYIKNQASRYFLAYHRKDHTRFVLRLVDSKQCHKIDFIVCERDQIPDISPKDIRSNMLYQIIAHNCARDMEATIQQISYAVTEARAVTNLNITVPHRKPDYKTFFPDMSSRPPSTYSTAERKGHLMKTALKMPIGKMKIKTALKMPIGKMKMKTTLKMLIGKMKIKTALKMPIGKMKRILMKPTERNDTYSIQ
jgi:hypothetical protein